LVDGTATTRRMRPVHTKSKSSKRIKGCGERYCLVDRGNRGITGQRSGVGKRPEKPLSNRINEL